MNMPRRRIVTGHDADGKSIILNDGPSPGRLENGEWEELWAFGDTVGGLSNSSDPADREKFRLVPQDGGIACRICIRPPEDKITNPASDREWQERLDFAETEVVDDSSGLFWHRTPTVDIFVIISGEMELLL